MSEPSYAIQLARPDITGREIDAVVDVLRSGHISLGPRLPEFEALLAERVGANYAVAVNSGTSALHLCLRSLNIKDGDEVITSPFSFIASANCMLFERARPVFVDIDPVTLALDPAAVEAAITPRTQAILPVHVFGLPADMNAITAIARKYKLAIIEDACEAIGATVNGTCAGTIGDCGTFAFYPNKQITTGEGGMIVTDNLEIARLCRSMRNQGRDDGMGWLSHARLGYNYGLSDVNCALGSVQLQRLDQILAQRAAVAEQYTALFSQLIPEIVVPCEPPAGMARSWFVYVVQLPLNYSAVQRNNLILHLRERGIGCNQYFPPIHLQPFYREMFGYGPGDFPVTESVSDHSLAIPFHTALSREDIHHVVSEIKQWLAANLTTVTA